MSCQGYFRDGRACHYAANPDYGYKYCGHHKYNYMLSSRKEAVEKYETELMRAEQLSRSQLIELARANPNRELLGALEEYAGHLGDLSESNNRLRISVDSAGAEMSRLVQKLQAAEAELLKVRADLASVSQKVSTGGEQICQEIREGNTWLARGFSAAIGELMSQHRADSAGDHAKLIQYGMMVTDINNSLAEIDIIDSVNITDICQAITTAHDGVISKIADITPQIAAEIIEEIIQELAPRASCEKVLEALRVRLRRFTALPAPGKRARIEYNK